MKDAECEKTIQAMGWADLRELWDRIQKGSVTGWNAGKAFEYLVRAHFNLMEPGSSGPIGSRFKRRLSNRSTAWSKLLEFTAC